MKAPRGRLRVWLGHLSMTAKVLIPVGTIVGLVAAALVWMFATFASADDVRRVAGDVRQLSVEIKEYQLRTRLQFLDYERFQLLQAQQARPGQRLTPLEQQRLEQIQTETALLKAELLRLTSPKK